MLYFVFQQCLSSEFARYFLIITLFYFIFFYYFATHIFLTLINLQTIPRQEDLCNLVSAFLRKSPISYVLSSRGIA